MKKQHILAIGKPIEAKDNNETSRQILQIINQVFRYAVIAQQSQIQYHSRLTWRVEPQNVTHGTAVLEKEKVAHLIMALAGYYPRVCALDLAPMLFVCLSELRCAT